MKQLLAVAAAISMVGGQAPAPVTVIRAARMIAGNAATVTAPAVVVIRGDRIASAGSTSRVPDGARIIDLGGISSGCKRAFSNSAPIFGQPMKSVETDET
jgi:hypothetical protein